MGISRSHTTRGASYSAFSTVHPANPASPLFLGVYATMLADCALVGPYLLGEGRTLTQRARVLVHNGMADDVDIARHYAAFAEAQT